MLPYIALSHHRKAVKVAPGTVRPASHRGEVEPDVDLVDAVGASRPGLSPIQETPNVAKCTLVRCHTTDGCDVCEYIAWVNPARRIGRIFRSDDENTLKWSVPVGDWTKNKLYRVCEFILADAGIPPVKTRLSTEHPTRGC